MFKVLSTKVVRDSISNVVLSNCANILNYVATLLAARAVGPLGLGEIVTYYAVLSLLTIPSNIAGTFVTQKTASDQSPIIKKMISLVRYGFSVALIGSFALSLCMGILLETYLGKLLRLDRSTLFFIAPGVLVASVQSLIMGVLIGEKQITRSGILIITASLFKVLGPLIALILAVQSTTIIILCQTIGTAVVALLAYTAIGESARMYTKQRFHLRRLTQLLRRNDFHAVCASSGTMILITNFDTLLATQFLDQVSIGYYASWAFAAKVVFFALGPIIGVNFVYQNAAPLQTVRNKYVYGLCAFICATGIPFYAGYTLFGPTLLGSVMGAEFLEIIPLLGSACIYGLVLSLLTHVVNSHMVVKSLMPMILIAFAVVYAGLVSVLKPNFTQFTFFQIVFVLISNFFLLVTYAFRTTRKTLASIC